MHKEAHKPTIEAGKSPHNVLPQRLQEAEHLKSELEGDRTIAAEKSLPLLIANSSK